MIILLQALSKETNVKANALEIVKGEEKTRKVSRASEGFACFSRVVSCGCE